MKKLRNWLGMYEFWRKAGSSRLSSLVYGYGSAYGFGTFIGSFLWKRTKPVRIILG